MSSELYLMKMSFIFDPMSFPSLFWTYFSVHASRGIVVCFGFRLVLCFGFIPFFVLCFVSCLVGWWVGCLVLRQGSVNGQSFFLIFQRASIMGMWYHTQLDFYLYDFLKVDFAECRHQNFAVSGLGRFKE